MLKLAVIFLIKQKNQFKFMYQLYVGNLKEFELDENSS